MIYLFLIKVEKKNIKIKIWEIIYFNFIFQKPINMKDEELYHIVESQKK